MMNRILTEHNAMVTSARNDEGGGDDINALHPPTETTKSTRVDMAGKLVATNNDKENSSPTAESVAANLKDIGVRIQTILSDYRQHQLMLSQYLQESNQNQQNPDDSKYTLQQQEPTVEKNCADVSQHAHSLAKDQKSLDANRLDVKYKSGEESCPFDSVMQEDQPKQHIDHCDFETKPSTTEATETTQPPSDNIAESLSPPPSPRGRKEYNGGGRRHTPEILLDLNSAQMSNEESSNYPLHSNNRESVKESTMTASSSRVDSAGEAFATLITDNIYARTPNGLQEKSGDLPTSLVETMRKGTRGVSIIVGGSMGSKPPMNKESKEEVCNESSQTSKPLKHDQSQMDIRKITNTEGKEATRRKNVSYSSDHQVHHFHQPDNRLLGEANTDQSQEKTECIPEVPSCLERASTMRSTSNREIPMGGETTSSDYGIKSTRSGTGSSQKPKATVTRNKTIPESFFLRRPWTIPGMLIMHIGLLGLGTFLGYISYMRTQTK